MLRELRITNFRALREFAMSGLGRVNLLVGTNNCGKTTVLEAIHALSASGNYLPLWQAQLRRGEFIERTTDRQIDVARLIHGHQLAEGHGFTISGNGPSGPQDLVATFIPREPRPKDAEEDEEDGDAEATGVFEKLPPMWLLLDWSGSSPGKLVRLPISRRGGLRDRPVSISRAGEVAVPRGPVTFVATDGLTRDTIVAIFDSVVLTPDETPCSMRFTRSSRRSSGLPRWERTSGARGGMAEVALS